MVSGERARVMENIYTDQKDSRKYISTKALERQLESMRRNLEELEKQHRQLENERLTYKNLLDAAPDAIVFVDRQGKILRVNAQLEKIFQYQADELNGQSIEKLIPERFRTKHREHIRKFFAHPRHRPMGTQYEIYGLRKDGEEFPADISLNFLKIDGIHYASASVRDITERKAMDDKLLRDVHMQRVISEVLKISLKPIVLQEQLDSILELILSVPVLFLEQKGAIYQVNEDRKSMTLSTLKGFDPADDLPCREIIIGRCLCGEAASQCKTVYADQLDERHHLIKDDLFSHGHYCVPIIENSECVGLLNLYVKEGHKRNGSEEKFITAIADTIALVIRHHRNEKEKFQLQEKLAEDEKMAALGRMAANFAHQVRNPLTTVGGLAKRLTDLNIGEREQHYAASIITEATRLELMLNNMFSFVQPPPLHCAKNDIVATIEEVLQHFTASMEKSPVDVRRNYQPVPELFFDRKLMILALENLIANALEAMPEGGVLSLSTTVNEDQGTMTVEVQDTGRGIEPDVLETIFEPFYTTKVGEKKIGLGLATAQKIAGEHDGRLDLQSSPGKGTAARLTLPFKINNC